jgi:hypothetical protein
MISTEPTAREGSPHRPQPNGPTRQSDPTGPLTTLRGAGVDVDVRRVLPFVVGACLVALATAVVTLTVAGLQKNDQINRLHRHGVVVDATVSGCIGLMGGSGSNLVGYDCRASFTLDGHHYDEPFAGNATPAPGSRFRAVTVPGDPALLATVTAVAGERASWRVFVLPAVLFVVLLLVIVTLLWLRARRRRAA